MADYTRAHYRPGTRDERGDEESYGGGASTQQVIAVVTLLPLGIFLLFISGGALAATLLGLAVAAPVFLIFSPVLVPAALAISLAVFGFLASGGFGIAGLSSLSWLANYVRRLRGGPPATAEKGFRIQDAAGYLGQKAREAGEAVQSKAQDITGGGTRTTGTGTTAQEGAAKKA